MQSIKLTGKGHKPSLSLRKVQVRIQAVSKSKIVFKKKKKILKDPKFYLSNGVAETRQTQQKYSKKINSENMFERQFGLK